MALEGLAAFAVAGTVFQFVEFAGKVVKTSYQIVRNANGDAEPDSESRTTAANLAYLASKLERPLRLQDSFGPSTQDEQCLLDICHGCQTVAEELLRRLKGFDSYGKPRPFETFRRAIVITWTHKERAKLTHQLHVYKGALEMRILVGLRENMNLLEIQQSARFDALDNYTKTIITSMLDKQSMLQDDLRIQTAAIAYRLNRIETATTKRLDRNMQSILDALDQMTMNSYSASGVSRPILQPEEQDIQRGVEIAVISNLHYPCLADRHEDIPEAHQKTFRWIFQEDSTGPWASFHDWLQSGSGLYWISGKAGSGKSTLMRYVSDSPVTQEKLALWASDTRLITAAFFFWNSGTVEQRSKSGLLRSLLFEVLSKYPELIPIVLPGLWATQYSKAINPLTKLEYDIRQISKLKQAFRNLIHQNTIPVKICFFIDGLDEYDGNDAEVAEIFSDLATHSHVKVCVSSRPLLVFEDAFAESPGLRLQDLTSEDIKIFVNDVLGENKRYKQLSLEEPVLAPTLVAEIVEKAQGVFLWVALVVNSLLSGLGNFDSITDLQRRLRLLPSDLQALYEHMLTKRIEPFYLPQSSKIFQILHAGLQPVPTLYHIEESELVTERERRPLTILNLALADEDNAHMVTAKAKPLTPSQLTRMCRSMGARLKARCAGLVEIQGFEGLLEVSSERKRSSKKPDYQYVEVDDKIQFLHRTVRDYLEVPGVWKKIIAQTKDETWNPSTCLLRSSVALLSVARAALPENLDTYRSVALQAMVHAHQADPNPSREYFQLLQRLDQVMIRNLNWNVDGNNNHWATHDCFQCEHEDPDESGYALAEDRDSFVSLAVQYGLCNFLADSLRRDKTLLPLKAGRPLLDYSLWPGADLHAEKRFPSNPDVTRILLQYGANPNERFNGRTCWENGLTFLWAISNGRDDLDPEFISRRLNSIGLLVKANASLLVLQTADGDLTPQSIVEGIVYKWCPEEMEDARKIFESRTGGWKYLRQIVGWVWGQSELFAPSNQGNSVPSHETGLGLSRFQR
ncbi:hypothetical protein BDZ45DRAFT_741784 [Acephala macrosclerotiorum]|nr:hypothetical protein BDZ45DRAFT_741784 [Acephala macrosclerotiorum]